MRVQSGALRALAVIIFVAGALLGLALSAGSVWADLEALFYGFDKLGDKPLSNVSCPLLMTASERARIRASFHNPFDKPLDLTVRTDISNPGPPRISRTQVALAPGETKQLDWIVTADDVDLGFFVFAQISTYPAFTWPFRKTTCGILVLAVAGPTGGQLLAGVVVASVFGMGIGLGLWQMANEPLKGRRLQIAYAMRFLAIVLLGALLFSFRGWWPAAGLLVLLAVVLASVLLFFLLAQ